MSLRWKTKNRGKLTSLREAKQFPRTVRKKFHFLVIDIQASLVPARISKAISKYKNMA